jgi:hypothetical protein
MCVGILVGGVGESVGQEVPFFGEARVGLKVGVEVGAVLAMQ